LKKRKLGDEFVAVPVPGKTILVHGERLRVVDERRGERLEVVIQRSTAYRYQDGRRLCGCKSKRYGVVAGARLRYVKNVDRAESDEVVILRNDGKRYRNGELVSKRSNPKPVQALCRGPAMRRMDVCRTHGAKSLAGIAHPNAGTLQSSKYTIMDSELAATYESKRRVEEPDNLAEELAILRSVVENIEMPRLQSFDGPEFQRGLDRVREGLELALEEDDLALIGGPLDALKELMEDSTARSRSLDSLRKQFATMATVQRGQVARRRAMTRVSREDLELFETRVTAAVRRFLGAMAGAVKRGSKTWRTMYGAASDLNREIASYARPVAPQIDEARREVGEDA
jgi:hypothetical protein